MAIVFDLPHKTVLLFYFMNTKQFENVKFIHCNLNKIARQKQEKIEDRSGFTTEKGFPAMATTML